MTTNFPVYK